MFKISKIMVILLITVVLGIILCNINKVEKMSASQYFYLDKQQNEESQRPETLYGGPSDKNIPQTASKCPQSNFVSTNLLPKNTDTVVDPAFEFAPKDLQNINFLDNKGRIGIDTQGSSLRNANYQIRDEPSNPKTVVSPWMNSTIDTDLHRKKL